MAVFGPTPEAALAAGFCAVLVALSVIDAQHGVVPNRIVVPVAAVALVAHTAIDPSLAWIAWSLVAAGVLFLVVLAYPKGLGMGDVKLALLLGAVLGASVTVALMLGPLRRARSGCASSSRGTARRRGRLGAALVPFLSLGAVVALFVGDAILDLHIGPF